MTHQTAKLAWMDHLAFSGGTVKGGAYRVLVNLWGHASPDGTSVFPSKATIAAEQGVSESVAQEWVTWAESSGWITRVRDAIPGARGTEYRLTIPEGARLHRISKAPTGNPVTGAKPQLLTGNPVTRDGGDEEATHRKSSDKGEGTHRISGDCTHRISGDSPTGNPQTTKISTKITNQDHSSSVAGNAWDRVGALPPGNPGGLASPESSERAAADEVGQQYKPSPDDAPSFWDEPEEISVEQPSPGPSQRWRRGALSNGLDDEPERYRPRFGNQG